MPLELATPLKRKTRNVTAIEQSMRRAESYDEWALLAKEHDSTTGMDRWRAREQSDQYDYHEISMRLQRLRQLLGRDDHEGLLFTLNEGIHGNMGGMGNPMLYNRAKFGTKLLISDYIEALAESITRIVSDDCSDIPTEEKLDFLHRAAHCFGRSALMLSGAGNLGVFHLGVVKALRDTNTLPHIISGSSAGALMAGCLGTHSEETLDELLNSENFAGLTAFEQIDGSENQGLASRMMFGRNGRLNLDYLEDILDRLIDDMTFAEAFELSGREINVSISPQERHQTPRLLNAITSPNVMIRSAVRASCAVPGAFPPSTLEAKSANGERIPYLPSRKWIDGSVVGDLPAKRLARLYGVNHFIVSQANPLVLWAKSDPKIEQGIGANLMRFFTRAAKEGFNSSFRLSREQLKRFPSVSFAANTMYSVLNQSYSGDVNIYPDFRFFDPRILLKKISQEEASKLTDNGMRATWPKIEMIRNCMRLSTILDDALTRYGNDYNDLPLPKSARIKSLQKKRPKPGKAA